MARFLKVASAWGALAGVDGAGVHGEGDVADVMAGALIRPYLLWE
ncbi:hypothetical protein [Nocardiopsis exhalans]|nr:hypothetical protein [Nocardiopsis exhalans]